MFIELLLAAILLVGAGTYMGLESAKIQDKRPADVWPAESHERFLRMCSISCGEDNLKSYSVSYGKCECKDTDNE
jgi:hypothetical protein